MHVKFDGNVYNVRFGYAVRESVDHKTGQGIFLWGGKALENSHDKHIRTYCDIAIADENGAANDSKWRGIAGSYVVRVPSDPFIKAEGRRLALSYACRQIPNREIRKAIWDEYFNQHSDAYSNTWVPSNNETEN